jgi:PAS domain S-box-containing protein
MKSKHIPIPENEISRLASLESFSILDSLKEEEYDAITRLASMICNVPIALITLIDSNRQWFKSTVGIDASETPREFSFCQYAILDNKILEVSNATLDPIFANNPLVIGEPNIRFYAGAPIDDGDGHSLGTLCVIDTKPNSLSKDQKESLRLLAKQVVSLLNLRKKNNQLINYKNEIDKLFNLSIDLVCIANVDGTLKRVNPMFEKVLGYTKEELEGKKFVELAHPDDLEQILKEVKGLSQGKLTTSFKVRSLTKSGQFIITNWNAAPDVVTGNLYAIGRDITDLIAIENKLKHQTNLLIESQSLAKIGSWELELNSNIVSFSNEFLNIIEFPKNKVCSFSDFMSCLDLNQIRNFNEKINEVKLGLKEIQFSHNLIGFGKSRKVVKEYLKCIFDEFDKPYKIVGTIQDVSEQKRIENELIKAKNLAIQSVQIKEQFLANMSHEIRTPMNGIIGFTKLLEDSGLDKEQLKYVESIQMAGENLMVIINDILDLSKIEANKMTFESIEFSLSKCVDSVLELFRYKANEKGIELISEISLKINDLLIGDPTRLSQILINLIGNSLKFIEEGFVELSVDYITEDEDEYILQFIVKDTGIGISQDKINSIFESFTQASNEMTRKYGGTGLGLTISKKMVELQGGSISCSSKLGEGSEFVVEMPFRKGEIRIQKEEIKRIQASISPNFLKGKKILLVEDNQLNQLLALKVFRKWNFELDIAENGKIAIEKVKNSNFDLILMDIQMPEMDGNEATKYIRENLGEKSNIPIIALTAHATSGEEQKCIDLGMDDYLSKPFDANDLLKKIYNLIKEDTTNYSIKPIVDLTYLKDLSEGDDDFVKEMITLYCENTKDSISIITKAFENEDTNLIKTEIHKMKSAFGLLGVIKGKSLIQKIEKSIESKIDLSSWKDEINLIIELCEISLKELEVELLKQE